MTLAAYLHTWRLKLSWSKTVSAAFYLAGHKLNVSLDGKCLPFTQVPIYLGVKLDRLLTYHQHLESLHGKLTSCITLMRLLAGSGWGANELLFEQVPWPLCTQQQSSVHLSVVAVYTPASLTWQLMTHST